MSLIEMTETIMQYLILLYNHNHVLILPINHNENDSMLIGANDTLELRESEVGDLCAQVRGEEDVERLEVEVQHGGPVLVQVVHAERRVARNLVVCRVV